MERKDAEDRWVDPAELVGFDTIGGMTAVKREIRVSLIEPMRHPRMAAAYGVVVGTKILLWGPPGCGKTLFARAAAAEVGAEYSPVQLSDILGSHFGEPENATARVFREAAESAPTVLFFDEVDSLAPNRNGEGMWEVERRLTNTFLQELDGARTDCEGVAVIGATNQPWLVDPAVIRAGRFDKLIYVGLPDHAARKEIWDISVRGLPLGPDVCTATLAELSEGLTGAEIAEAGRHVCCEAFLEAVARGSVVDVRMLDLLVVLRESRPRSADWLSSVPGGFARREPAVVADSRAVRGFGAAKRSSRIGEAIEQWTKGEINAWEFNGQGISG